jgi:hypothetical protein
VFLAPCALAIPIIIACQVVSGVPARLAALVRGRRDGRGTTTVLKGKHSGHWIFTRPGRPESGTCAMCHVPCAPTDTTRLHLQHTLRHQSDTASRHRVVDGLADSVTDPYRVAP